MKSGNYKKVHYKEATKNEKLNKVLNAKEKALYNKYNEI